MNPVLKRAALCLQRSLGGFDRAAESADVEVLETRAPVFLVGAPRTGSTAIFLALLSAHRASYISNVMAQACCAMIKMIRASPSLGSGYRGGMAASHYGFVSGFRGPNEAGAIMDMWFGSSGQWPDVQVRQTIAAITEATGCPLITKNLANSLRLRRIHELFPSARFVHVRRDPRYVAQSLLQARRQALGDEQRWFSVRPPGWERQAQSSVHEQVVWQVHALDRPVLEFSEAHAGLVTAVEYEAFCENPAGLCAAIGRELGLEPRPGRVQEMGPVRGNRRSLSAADWDAIERANAALEPV